ncbi:hypothetical protein J6590_050985 [Homalodisca vitripennis]|nr:hypothetical protein J6590_050985 [Homalodisca vitripennis]
MGESRRKCAGNGRAIVQRPQTGIRYLVYVSSTGIQIGSVVVQRPQTGIRYLVYVSSTGIQIGSVVVQRPQTGIRYLVYVSSTGIQIGSVVVQRPQTGIRYLVCASGIQIGYLVCVFNGTSDWVSNSAAAANWNLGTRCVSSTGLHIGSAIVQRPKWNLGTRCVSSTWIQIGSAIVQRPQTGFRLGQQSYSGRKLEFRYLVCVFNGDSDWVSNSAAAANWNLGTWRRGFSSTSNLIASEKSVRISLNVWGRFGQIFNDLEFTRRSRDPTLFLGDLIAECMVPTDHHERCLSSAHAQYGLRIARRRSLRSAALSEFLNEGLLQTKKVVKISFKHSQIVLEVFLS